MNLEKIKRVPLISFLYRTFHIGYGTCGVCGLPWSNCNTHTIEMTEHDGFFPVCEYCWEHADIKQIKQACTKLYYTWKSQGIIPYTIDEMHQAVDRFKAQKGEKCMTDKVQKIKEWISKKQDGLMDANGNFEYPEHEGAYNILCNLDTYIDFLQEEPKFKTGDRIKPIDSCLGSPRTIVDICDSWYVTDQGTLDFEYEDNWELAEEHKKCMYSKDNYTNEGRKAFCDGCEEECEYSKKKEPVSENLPHIRHRDTLDEFAYQCAYDLSNDWAKETPEWKDIKTACKLGAQWQKQQMIKDAIEAEIINWASMFTSIKVIEPERAEAMIKEKFDIGDKVKLIIVKED